MNPFVQNIFWTNTHDETVNFLSLPEETPWHISGGDITESGQLKTTLPLLILKPTSSLVLDQTTDFFQASDWLTWLGHITTCGLCMFLKKSADDLRLLVCFICSLSLFKQRCRKQTRKTEPFIRLLSLSVRLMESVADCSRLQPPVAAPARRGKD